MRDQYGRLQTYAQALREMNTGDMACFSLDNIKEVTGLILER